MNKIDRLTVYLLPCHKRAVEKLARREGESQAAIVRRLIRREAEDFGIWDIKEAGCERLRSN